MQKQPKVQPAVRAIIFDLGGVILRTEDTQPRAGLAQRLGFTYAALDAIVFNNSTAQRAERGQATPDEVWAEAARLLNLPPDEIPRVRREFFAGDRVDQDLIALIHSLRGDYKTALLSNTWFSDLPRFLREDLGIPDTFDVVISSAREGLAKPDPRIFQVTLEALGIEAAEAVFVDDNLANVQAAGQLGIRAVRFFSVSQMRQDLGAFIRLPSAPDEQAAGGQ